MTMTTTTGARPSSSALGPIVVPREAPGEECDVIMKGGITSAVVYPRALCEFAKHYRLHGLGGTSAGAIGAVAGAAAEYGRSTGGFDKLAVLPKELYGGKLGELFIPAFGTRGLFRIMKAATVSVGKSLKVVRRIIRVVVAVLLAYWYVAVLWLIFLGEMVRWATHGGTALAAAVAWTLVAAGVAVGMVLFLLYVALTRGVPRNNFGICKGLGSGAGKPGFTDWLHVQVQDLAGRTSNDPPLTFGDLAGRNIDLRMMTTCVNLGRPYELPTKARTFYYKESEWKGIFPEKVMAALAKADRAQRAKLDADVTKLRGRPPRGALPKAVWKRACADAEELVQLPAADQLPVIVAARLSLSYPLLISAVPMWTVDYRDEATQAAVDAFDADADADATRTTAAATSAEAKKQAAQVELDFKQVWFTDGGFSSNFPVHFFDSALPVRPAYIVNLGRFPNGRPPSADELENIQYETSNRWLPPELADFPSKGRKGLVGFGAGAFNTARNWHDNSYLDFPGFRDRIVRVLQTRDEGGLNLNMGQGAIDRLAGRGQAAAQALVGQFTNDEAYAYGSLTFSGWQNHQWVRYRALLSALPEWLDGWQGGRKLPKIAFGRAPSYRLTGAAARTAGQLSVAMDKVAQLVPPIQPAGTKGPDVRGKITRQPNPLGGLHRVPPT